tara:strand:+ start:263 stop:892 length:630 start_codon:yes stop_codon:yes gene_type:complete
MRLFNYLKKNRNDNFSQSGQDQFAYNLSGFDGNYLEIGAHDPIINSNTYNLEVKCRWKGLSIENDKSFKESWNKLNVRKNEVIWDDAFKINYSKLVKDKNFPDRFDYLSCDIEPAENTFNILKKIINSGLSFNYISFEHDKYNIGNKYEGLSIDFLNEFNYKVAITDVYSRRKKYKIYETWFVNSDINFLKTDYETWKNKFYKDERFDI